MKTLIAHQTPSTMDTPRDPGYTSPNVANLDIIGGIPAITAIGTPRMIGETIGQRLKPRLQVLAQYLKEQLSAALSDADPGRASNDLQNHLRKLTVPLARTEPSMWMEIESIARTTGISEEDLLLIHGWGDLLSHYGCLLPPMRSSYLGLSATHTDTGMSRMVYAWHLDPALFPYITLIKRMPSHGPASVTLTLAGLHPVAGLSEAGIAACSNELRVVDGTEGHFTAHLLSSILNAPGFDDALSRAKLGPRHGGAAIHLLGGNGERATIELSGQTTAKLIDNLPLSPRVHTNHALDGEVMRWTSRVSDASSKDRLAHLAGRAIEARACDPAFIATWFGMKKSLNPGYDSPGNGPDGLAPETSVLLVMDPGKKCIYAKRGGSPARMESITL